VNLRKLARGQSCVRCGTNDGTVVLAHYTGPRQHQYGKGKGCKGSDAVGAHLCWGCHGYFDKYESGNTWERSEEFLHFCALTWIRVVTA
jgi:hypothetical protein